MSACLKIVPAVMLAVLVATPALAAGPLAVTGEVRVEQRVAAPDGTTRIVLAAPARVVPGDGVVFTLRYHNGGTAPLADVVLANPVPRGIVYRAPVAGMPVPEVSVDGRRFGALADLRVPVAGGARVAQPGDVVAVRWRLARPIGAGASGMLAFAGVVK